MCRPRATITVGAAGVALFLVERARASGAADRARFVEQAIAWLNAAQQALRHPRTAYGFPNTPFKASRNGVAVFHGRAGVHIVAARIASLRGDVTAFCTAEARFLDAWQAACAREDFPSELFFGAAGFIFAARDLEIQSVALNRKPDKRVRAVGREACRRIRDRFVRLAGKPLRAGTKLGYAHGLAGELDAVLAWDPRPSTTVAAMLDQVLAHALVEGALAAWPARVGEEPAGPLWATWCNGMAGHVYLWCRAYEVFRDERYLTAARLAAQTTAELLPPNPTVCCGMAGQAFALYRYLRLTGEEKFRRHARSRARRACAQATTLPKSTLGYFAGLSGIAHVAFAIVAGKTPRLPLIDDADRPREMAECPGKNK